MNLISETEETELVRLALEAMAYAPYSGYTVGAALLMNIWAAILKIRSHQLCELPFSPWNVYRYCHCRWNRRRGSRGICLSLWYLQTGDAGILHG